MGGAELPGCFECADRVLCEEPAASAKAVGRASRSGAGGDDALLGGESCGGEGGARGRVVWHAMVAFLAALVSAPVLPVLLRGVGASDDAVHTRMARREIIGFRSLADGSAADHLARAVRHAAAERWHAVLLSDVLHLSADTWRHSVLPAGVAGVLVGDDLLDGGICVRVFDRHVFPD